MSNVDSFGCPVDHDGYCLEDGVFHSENPIAVRGDVLRDILSGSGQDVAGAHLDSDFLKGPRVTASLLGGIPVVERVEIEDVTDGYSSAEPHSPRDGGASGGNQTSATVSAMMRTMKNEREELYSARKKLQDALSFLKKKGYNELDIFSSSMRDGFGTALPNRDDFGLPKWGSGKSSEESKPSAETKSKAQDVPHVFDEMSKKEPPNPFVDKMKGKLGEEVPQVQNGGKSWANVLKKESPAQTKFDYFPLEKDAISVEPPLETLKKGNDKFKCCVVGTFTKGTKPFREVADFANRMWSNRGLIHVSQKDNHTFIFRFDTEKSRDEVLSRGTWYIARRPMVVTCWGVKPGMDNVDSMPIWIKISGIPDSYWTEEGLSRLASVVGKPLGADILTSKLEIMPFARMQVLYKLGTPMPTEFLATVLDPVTEEKFTTKVLYSYPLRPLFCTGCNSLGHSVGACPRVNRVWVKKDPVNAGKSSGNEPVAPHNVEPSSVVLNRAPVAASVQGVTNTANEETWTEVKRKKDLLNVQEASPSPPQTFRNLKNVDEIDKRKGAPGGSNSRLTKSQKRKLRLKQGTESPNHS